MAKNTRIIAISLSLTFSLITREAGGDSEIRPPAEIFLVDFMSTDSRTFSAEAVIAQCDVHLEVHSQELARSFKRALQDRMVCGEASGTVKDEYKGVVRFTGDSSQYLISVRYVRSSDLKCRKDLDPYMRDILLGLLLTNNPAKLDPESWPKR